MGGDLHVVGWPLVFMEDLHKPGVIKPTGQTGV